MLRRSRRFISTFVLSSAVAASLHAAELGEARVSSHIGQQLVADIELTMVEDPAAPVAVRLASPEVYSGAGIAMPAVLGSLSMSVMRRDGRQFLHLTSLRPVAAEHLHLYLELTDKGQRAVRLATLWLTPDPNPAPPPVPAPAPVPVPVPVPVQAAHPAPVPVQAAPKVVAPPVRRPKPAPPAVPVPKPAPPAAHADSAPACVRQPDEAQACVALGARNAVLREQLGKLEDKVKGLQATTGAAAAQPAAQPEPPKPKPISAIKPLVPHKPKAPPAEEGGLPWAWIGAGAALLAAVGGGAAVVLRRRGRSRNADIPDAPGPLDKLRQRFAARTRAPAAREDAAAEPTLE
jgi:hypothetical protein